MTENESLNKVIQCIYNVFAYGNKTNARFHSEFASRSLRDHIHGGQTYLTRCSRLQIIAPQPGCLHTDGSQNGVTQQHERGCAVFLFKEKVNILTHDKNKCVQSTENISMLILMSSY